MYCHYEEMDLEISTDLHIITPLPLPEIRKSGFWNSIRPLHIWKNNRWWIVGWVAIRGFRYPVMKKIFPSSFESIPELGLRSLLSQVIFSVGVISMIW
jgi:hypothetical protein